MTKLEEVPYYPKEEDEDDDIEEDQEDLEIIDDSWSKAKLEDLDLLQIPQEPVAKKVPLDYAQKKYIIFYMREPNIEDQLRIMEQFMTMEPPKEKKHGQAGEPAKVSFNLLAYYKAMWIACVVRTDPRIKWSRAKYYGGRFLKMLMDHLPNPMDLMEGFAGVTEIERKN